MADTVVRTQRFYGLNRQPCSEEGEMIDMKNLSSDAFPYLKTRECREEYGFFVAVDAKLGEGGYIADVTELPPASSVSYGDVYKLIPSEQEFESGEIYASEDGAWVKKDKSQYLSSEVVTIGGSLTLSSYLRTDEFMKETYDNTYNTYGSIDEYINQGPNHLRYLGDTTGGFIHGKNYEYKIKVVKYEWKMVSTTNWPYPGRVKELPEFEPSIIGKEYYYTGTTTETGEFVKYTYYRCVGYIQGYWEETENDPYEVVISMGEPTEEGKTVRYCADTVNPVYDGRYMVENELYNESDIYFYSLAEKDENEIGVETLPEPSEEICGNIYRYISPSENGFYVCVNNGEESLWKLCGTPVVTKNFNVNDYVSEYSQMLGLPEFNVKRVLRIHEHNGKLAVLLENDEGETALYYDNKLITASGSDKTRMHSVGNLIMLGDGNTYYDAKNKDIKKGDDTFEHTLYGGSGRKNWIYESGNKTSHICKSYINSYEIVLYSEDEEYFKSALSTFNLSNIDFEIKTDYSQGWEYATTSAAASLTYDYKGVNLGSGVTDEWGMWKLTIPIRTMLFPPSLTKKSDGSGEGWVYLRKTSKNTRFLWKNRLWGYDENNLISTILGVLDEKMDIDWDTVADGRNDNGAYTLSFMTGGDVTGIAALRDYITVFKRNHICTLSGNTSATFLMNTISAFGLSEENEKSIAVCGNTVFYMSDDGVYTFSGDYPVRISEKAKLEGKPVAAAADNRFYYLSLEKDGEYTNYRYDILKGLWYKMNNIHIQQYCQLNGKMLYIDADTEKIMTVGENEKVEWEAVLTFDEGTWRKKKYKEFAIYGEFDEVDILAKADDGEEKAICHTKKQGKFCISQIVCEKLTIKIRGRGEAVIKGFERKYEVI